MYEAACKEVGNGLQPGAVGLEGECEAELQTSTARVEWAHEITLPTS